jgi:hypothetical protein
MASGTGLLPYGPGDSRETHPQPKTANGDAFQESGDGVEGSRQTSDPTGAPKGEPTSHERQLGLFVETEADLVDRTSQFEWQWLRACELVRLLNSTPLGAILNDRQLYRHRQEAPWVQCGKHHIDFLRYVAFLFDRRHRPKPRRRRGCGREVLTLAELRDILRRQNFRCALTGQQLTPTNFALDHIVPVISGGDFTAGNAQLVLKSVNRAKNTMSEQDFIEMCRQVARHRQGDFATLETSSPINGVQA